MKAYKVWYDEKYFIHKNTIDEINVSWTTNIKDAKDILTYSEAIKFFYDKLGFAFVKQYDALKLL